MQRKDALTSLIYEQLAIWLRSTDTPNRASINCGYCADFRDGVFYAFKRQPALADIDFDNICYSDLALGEDRPTPPPGLTWEQLGGHSGLLKNVCHEWIRLDGFHFDSEVPEGVASPFEVPCVRRSLAGALALDQPELLAELVTNPWWMSSVRMATSNIRWYLWSSNETASPRTQALLEVMEKLVVYAHEQK
jgi:hypothetical protein